MSDESDAGPHPQPKRKRKTNRIVDTSVSSDGSPIIGSSSRRVLRRPRVTIEDDSDSDSGSSIILSRRKRVARVNSEASSAQTSDSPPIKITRRTGQVFSDSESSGSDIVNTVRRPGRVVSDSDGDGNESDHGFEGSSSSQWEADFSDTDVAAATGAAPLATAKVPDTGVDSDSSDGQSEKCPICLLSFKTQEIGTPEACDHMFCVDCIQEWSKNMNTCPVDRQKYTLILVRSSLDGKIVRQIPVQTPTPQNEIEIIEDPTFCEVCGSSDREERMLLCDGCDLGYHLECLTPPLDDIPAGSWYCPDCSSPSYELLSVDFYVDSHSTSPRSGPRRSQTLRLAPRTPRTERVRNRIRNNRSNTIAQNDDSSFMGQPSSSGQRSTNPVVQHRAASTNSRQRNRRKKKSRSHRAVYRIDSATGETVLVRKRRKSKKKKGRRGRNNRDNRVQPKTVKSRLALHLGICAPRSVPQNLPDVKIQINAGGVPINHQRYQAGIPTLDLFGNRHELDSFSPSEDEMEYGGGGSGYLVRRAPNRSDVAIFRRIARTKAAGLFSAPAAVSSSTDVLGSILDSQSQFHSRNTVFSVDKQGNFKMDKNEKEKSNPKHQDVNKLVRQAPGYSQNQRESTAPSSTNFPPPNMYQSNTGYSYSNYMPPHSSFGQQGPVNYSGGYDNFDVPQDYSQRTLTASNYLYQPEEHRRNRDGKDENDPRSNTPSESEVDIYSDIENETVSTSRLDDFYLKPPPTPPILRTPPQVGDDEENDRDSDAGMVIDTEKTAESEKYDPMSCDYDDDDDDYDEDPKEETEAGEVTSTVDTASVNPESIPVPTVGAEQAPVGPEIQEIQSQAVQSSDQVFPQDEPEPDKEGDQDEDDQDSEDGCPNFSIYSKESINMAKTTDLTIMQENSLSNLPSATPESENNQVEEVSSTPVVPLMARPNVWSDEDSEDESVKKAPETEPEKNEMEMTTANGECHEDEVAGADASPKEANDSLKEVQEEGEEIDPTVKKVKKKLSKGIGGLYSDSEDESVVKKGGSKFALSDLRNMTEDISEEERSYTPCLDENRMKYKGGLEGLDTEMISDEDRNDFDESHELKTGSDGDALEINAKESELDFTRPDDYEEGEIIDKTKGNKPDEPEVEEKSIEEEVAPAPEDTDLSRVEEALKIISKESEVQSKEPSSFKKLSKSNKERNYRDKDNKEKGRNKENQKERLKVKASRLIEKEKREKRKRREIERYDVRALIAEKPRRLKDKFGRDIRQTPSRSRSKSRTPPVLVNRSPSRVRTSPPRRKQKSGDRASNSRSRSRGRKRSPSKKKRRRSSSRDRRRKRRKSRDRTKTKPKKARSLSRHDSPSEERRHREWNKRHSREWTPSVSPSWTPPPHVAEQQVQPHNLTVILPNDANKKKKEKRKRTEKRPAERQRKRRRAERTPPPSKEVFASGDNILVSVSFNKENETRDVSTSKKKREEEVARKRRERRRRLAKKNVDVSGIKPVAVIDLERSPFREITSPKDVIVLTDSDNEANAREAMETGLCDSSQQVASPERCINNYTMGPKTPPEPQIKFSLNSKQPQLRAINNPLGDADELENEIDVQEELEERLNESMYKGPNTPPEPPNSPPSSPDVYDPFEPTKSRSPTPEPLAINPPNDTVIPAEETREDSILIETIRTGISEIMDNKNVAPVINLKSIDISKSHTPPIADIQPADSQSSLHPGMPDSPLGKSPDMTINLNQTPQTPTFTSKPVAQTVPFSSVPTSMITSTPVSTSLAPPRINILNNTVINPSGASSSIPQRIVLPNTVKSSPVKISPTKPAIKSTPIKPMPTKTIAKPTPRKSTSANRSQISTEVSEMLDFDSPYSPGSSDYEDLFDPPTESSGNKSKSKTPSKSPGKIQNIFDVLFGSSSKTKSKTEKPKYKKIAVTPTKGTKLVGVKMDEDSLKILDDLPSSAVEMQVKDKFLKKLNRQERVVEEVKLVLKPYYNKKKVTKDEYKDIMRRAVPKICHNKSGEINPTKIKNLVEAYVKKIRHNKKVTSSSSVNPQKV